MLSEQTQIEQTQTDAPWAQFPGQVLEGGYEIQELLEADGHGAKFQVRVLGDRNLRAFVHMVRGNGSATDEQVQVWETARKISHPNLSTPLACGRIEMQGSAYFYVVQRQPEETLSAALRERALTAAEAGQVVVSVAHALENLLRSGLVHGCVSPEQIVATGDTIQLTTECVRRIGAPPAIATVNTKYVAPESAGVNVTPAADVWCFGASVFEILTQSKYGPHREQEITQLPAPFATIAQRCLTPTMQTRCDLAEVLVLYRGERTFKPAPVPPTTPLPELVRIPQIGAKKVNANAVRRPAQRTQARGVEQRGGRTTLIKNKPLRGFPAWAYVIGVIIVAAIVWTAWPRHSAPTRENVAVHGGVPAPAGNAWETRTLRPDGASVKLQASAAPATASSAAVAPSAATVSRREPLTKNGPVWRVVLFTYNREEDAQKKAHAVNDKHREWNAEVFSPNGHSGPYLVTAGGQMNRDDAARLRRKVMALGMPRDSYIQNYAH